MPCTDAHPSGVSVSLNCPICRSGDTRIGKRSGKIVHRIEQPRGRGGRFTAVLKPQRGDIVTYGRNTIYRPCPDWDDEYRHVSEPMGFFRFAWLPVICRNGKKRWLAWVECFPDGTYTLGDRAD